MEPALELSEAQFLIEFREAQRLLHIRDTLLNFDLYTRYVTGLQKVIDMAPTPRMKRNLGTFLMEAQMRRAIIEGKL